MAVSLKINKPYIPLNLPILEGNETFVLCSNGKRQVSYECILFYSAILIKFTIVIYLLKQPSSLCTRKNIGIYLDGCAS